MITATTFCCGKCMRKHSQLYSVLTTNLSIFPLFLLSITSIIKGFICFNTFWHFLNTLWVERWHYCAVTLLMLWRCSHGTFSTENSKPLFWQSVRTTTTTTTFFCARKLLKLSSRVFFWKRHPDCCCVNWIDADPVKTVMSRPRFCTCILHFPSKCRARVRGLQ